MMTAITGDVNSVPLKEPYGLPEGQIVLLTLLLCVVSSLVLSTIEPAALSATLLFAFISIFGLMLCSRTRVRLNDTALSVLGYFWLTKLALTIFLLYAGWMPELNATSASTWGYDPQRYYLQAQELIDNDWVPNFVSLYYVGILYYYGAIFYLLGHNPLIPAVINAFVTLVACLFLVKVGYEIKSSRGAHDWKLALCLLLPDTLWFDVMTSRETLVAALLVFALFSTGRYFLFPGSNSLAKLLVVLGVSLGAVAAVRTSMLLPALAAIAMMALLSSRQRGSLLLKGVVVIGITTTALILGPILTGYLGGYEFNLLNVLQTITSAADNIALTDDVQWSDSSIGMLLLPANLVQAIAFVPLRMVLYLVAPLPNFGIDVSELTRGSWVAWQNLFSLLSALLNVLIMPYAFASLVQAARHWRANPGPTVFHISYWITFAAVAGGNLIVHERYRVMVSSLLWGCAWLGAGMCAKSQVFKAALVWYGVLVLGAVFYMVHKIL